MPQPRESPYIGATWLARLLAGEAHCEWAGWFRAHYRDWTKSPSDFDQTRWMLDHTALVSQARESREALGYEVRTENQNSFVLRGATRHTRREAGPHRHQGKRRRGHRRQNEETQPTPRRPGHDLPVFRPQGSGGVPGDGVPGPRDLLGLKRRSPGLGSGQEVCGPAGRPYPETGRRGASQKGAIGRGVPVVRHHPRRLARAGGGGRTRTGRDHG